jgi:hypothetical protein
MTEGRKEGRGMKEGRREGPYCKTRADSEGFGKSACTLKEGRKVEREEGRKE